MHSPHVRWPTRQTYNVIFLGGTILVLAGEGIVMLLLAYSAVVLPEQTQRLAALALYGVVPAITCTAGLLAWRQAAAEVRACPYPHDPNLHAAPTA